MHQQRLQMCIWTVRSKNHLKYFFHLIFLKIFLRIWVDDYIKCTMGVQIGVKKYFYNSTQVTYAAASQYCKDHNATIFYQTYGTADFLNILNTLFGTVARYPAFWVNYSIERDE